MEGKLKKYIMTELNPEKIFKNLKGDCSNEKSVTITSFKYTYEWDTYALEFRLTFSFIATKNRDNYWENTKYYEEPTEGYYKFECDVLCSTIEHNIVALEIQEKDIPYFTKDVIWQTISESL